MYFTFWIGLGIVVLLVVATTFIVVGDFVSRKMRLRRLAKLQCPSCDSVFGKQAIVDADLRFAQSVSNYTANLPPGVVADIDTADVIEVVCPVCNYECEIGK